MKDRWWQGFQLGWGLGLVTMFFFAVFFSSPDLQIERGNVFNIFNKSYQCTEVK